MAEKLKPCPFCGGNAEHYVGHSMSNDTTLPHEIRCKDIFGCGACIRESISPYSKDYEKQVENLYDRWNTRQTLKEREENAN